MLDFTPSEYQYLQVLTSFIHVISLSLLTFLISRRVPQLHQRNHLTWGKVCSFLFLVDCWLFVFFSGLFSTGIGTRTPILCTVMVWSCLLFQGSIKVLKYAFLIEKCHIVWSGGHCIPRFKTKVYRICSAMLLGFGSLIPFHVKDNHIREDKVCIVVFDRLLLLMMGVADFVLNVSLTYLFLMPLRRTNVCSPMLREVARKTLYGCVISLIISVANIVTIIVLGDVEMLRVCMISCVLDATLNALVLYWVSSGASSYIVNHLTIPDITVTKTSTAFGTQWSPTSKIDQDIVIERRHSF